MKRILYYLILSQACYTAHCQDITDIVTNSTFQYQQLDIENYEFTFHTYFSVGFQSTCIPFVSSNIQVSDDTLIVNGYYDVRGSWPFVGCERINVVSYLQELPTSIQFIKMVTNVITYDESNIDLPLIIENVYSQTFNLDVLNVHSDKDIESIKLWPNPSFDHINISEFAKFSYLEIFDASGRKVITYNHTEKNQYNISHLNEGIYSISFYDEKDKKINTIKVIKTVK